MKYFYYCEQCNKALPQGTNRCACGRRFRDGDDFFSESEIESLLAAGEKKASDDTLEEQDKPMLCPKCQKRYSRQISICTCGELLQMVPQEPVEAPAEPMQKRGHVSYEEGSYLEIIVDEGTITEAGFYGKPLEKVEWELELCRYVGQYRIPGEPIKVNKEVMALGRRSLVMDNVFGTNWERTQNALLNISSYCALLVVKENGLYIQYDWISDPQDHPGVKKSPIRVGNRDIQPLESVRLADGEKIVLGYPMGAGMSGRVEVTVKQLSREAGMSEEALEKIYGRIDGRIGQLQTSVEHLMEFEISKYKTLEEYQQEFSEQVKELAQAGRLQTEEEYLEQFFEGYADKDEVLSVLTEAERREIVLAAIAEDNLERSPKKQRDYAEAYMFVGKMLEMFAFQEIYEKLILNYGNEKTINELKDLLEKHGSLMYGQIVRCIKYYSNEEKRVKLRDKFAEGLLNGYNAKNPNNKMTLDELSDILLPCTTWADYRNKAAHTNTRAIKVSDLEEMTYEQYHKAKKAVFGSGTLNKIVHVCKIITGE